ncbi:MAG: methylenetetrahydrofolate reductase, partial [Schwartzia sp.]|nr:methylenetetrahydrofolate reductase [Schwartzia sp. (in: firmicutes)]
MPTVDKQDRAIFSFEIFPPKRDMPLDTVYRTLDELTDLEPDFISVTCGAGGSADGSNRRTIEVASAIRNKYHREGIAHLPCIHFTRDDVLSMLDELEKNGVQKILALRGDRVPDLTPKDDFRHASDLIAFIRAHAGDRFQIFAACYPEGHTESPDLDADIKNLRKKVDAGVDRLISQLFFDNEFFYEFLDKSRKAGNTVPVEAGIMPVPNKKQIER